MIVLTESEWHEEPSLPLRNAIRMQQAAQVRAAAAVCEVRGLPELADNLQKIAEELIGERE